MVNIQEDLGYLGGVLNTPNPQNQMTTSKSDFAHNRQGIELFKYNFVTWQQEINNALRLNSSIYVVASPGAGKTAPVMYSWAQNILKVNPSMVDQYVNDPNRIPHRNYITLIANIKKILTNPESIHKVLYAVPTRTLCDQIYNEVSNLLYQILFISLDIVQSFPKNDVIQYIHQNFNINLKKELLDRQKLMSHYNRLIQTFNMNRNQNIEKNMLLTKQQIEQLDKMIHIKLAKQVKNYVQNVLVQRATEVYTPNTKKALFIIAVHRSAYSKVFRKVGKHIKTIIVDEAHKLQYNPNEPIKDKQDVIDCSNVLYKILRNKEDLTNVIFLSGTVNPISARNLINYLNYCLNIKITQLTSSGGNASKISVIPNDSINNHQTLVNLLTGPKENNNLIILFSKKLIESLITKALEQSTKFGYTSKDIDAGSAESSNFQQLPMATFQRNKTNIPNQSIKFNSKELINMAAQMPGASEIENPLLRAAVLHGFGYIFRPDKKTMSKSELKTAMKDQQIVVDLFSSGKLKTILATDAVGIGLNIKVKNVYIPTISKFNGVDFQKLGIADASQLYNRVGRRDFQISTIYTPEQNINDILNAISVGNSGFEQRDVIQMNKSMCVMNNFYSIYSAFK